MDTNDDPLDDFDARTLELDGVARRVYTSGQGPGVIVMAEMPGISPDVARFSRWIRQAGFTVYLPSLFGRDGAHPLAEDGLEIMRRACISAEFHALAGRGSSPVTSWLRALARFAHRECGGIGTGAVGMCFTGNFALAMMLEPSMLAPVLAQPSLPLDDPAALESDAGELQAVRERLERDDLSVLAYRFEGDRHCRAERFAAYTAALGPRFVARVLPDDAARSDPPPFFRQVVGCPHSVFTAHLVDAEGSPTRRACDEVVAFLRARLWAPALFDAETVI
ncbi:dienelactone hydrolase family protein [Dokdonella sp.]|uniref:dienelactone hydrolase family protein n=1 Tax=Dokdonella sp. TaxID=2291710 RepID=UPI003784DC74